MMKPQLVFGTGTFGLYDGSTFNSPQVIKPHLDNLLANKITRIDTARRYPPLNSGTSEQVLGENDLSSFKVDTKAWSMPGHHTPAGLEKSLNESLEALQIPHINTLYLHYPDSETPLEQMLQGITELHKSGKFTNFGLSNYTIPQLDEILHLCSTKGYLKPTVYQGQYNPLSRDCESDLFPLLRKNNISFTAYSPAAAGAFNKNSRVLNDQTPIGDQFRKLYGHPAALTALEKVRDAAEKHGITGHAVAIRWTHYHSQLDGEKGDAMIIGATRPEQLQGTADAINDGPLPGELVGLMEEVWNAVREGAPRYSMWA